MGMLRLQGQKPSTLRAPFPEPQLGVSLPDTRSVPHSHMALHWWCPWGWPGAQLFHCLGLARPCGSPRPSFPPSPLPSFPPSPLPRPLSSTWDVDRHPVRAPTLRETFHKR